MENRQLTFRRSIIACVLISVMWMLSASEGYCKSINKLTQYHGGKSTPLRAVIGIAAADKVPLGITFGLKHILCDDEQIYNFDGMTTFEALRKAIDRTGYSVTLENGVYELTAPDLTRREEEVRTYEFPTFYAEPASMKDLGVRLTAYISDVIEGAGGFVINTMSSTNDEVVAVTKMNELTAPQIANEIVKLGSKGIWIMQAAHGDAGPKVGSTTITIYSYHDAISDITQLSCPQASTKVP